MRFHGKLREGDKHTAQTSGLGICDFDALCKSTAWVMLHRADTAR